MPRTVILNSGPWSDLTLEDLASRSAGWGFQGVELACSGDHFEVQRAVAETAYCTERLDLLARHDLHAPVINCARVSQAVCDPIDPRHESLVPEYVWGNGEPEGVRQRAAEEVLATIRAAQKMGVGVIAGNSGSSLWSSVAAWPGPNTDSVAQGLRDFAERWAPLLDACQECGVRYALEVQPGQIAFDLYSAEATLDAIDGRDELGFLFNPSQLFWQGVDPVEFLLRFPDRIAHVHVNDVVLNLNGRTGALNSYLPPGDPRRGWEHRAPGRGGLDWESIIRALNHIGYDGAMSVDWQDAGMDRDHGAEEAVQFLKRLSFETPPKTVNAFR